MKLIIYGLLGLFILTGVCYAYTYIPISSFADCENEFVEIHKKLTELSHQLDTLENNFYYIQEKYELYY